MPKSYDVEDLVQDVENFVKPRLNAEIALVESEKVSAGRPASGIQDIPDEAYYQFGWTNEVLNRDVGLIISPDIVASEGHGAFTKLTVEVDIAVVITGTQNDPFANQKALRYAKALKQVFEKNWGKVAPGIVREKIETTGPVDLKVTGRSNEPVKAAGVVITAVLG